MAYNWDYLDKKAYNNRVGKYKFKYEYKFICKAGNCNFKSILDIGGGSGRFAIPLYQFSKDITVLEPNSDALELLSKREPNIKTINSDFLKADLNRTYSHILCIEALGYFNDWEVFFNRVLVLLENNGRFVFLYQNPSSWRFQLRRLKHWRKGFYNYQEMKLDDLKLLLNKCGFEIVEMDGMNWMPVSLSSNSILVLLFEKIERYFNLNKWYFQSPWIMFSVKKTRLVFSEEKTNSFM